MLSRAESSRSRLGPQGIAAPTDSLRQESVSGPAINVTSYSKGIDVQEANELIGGLAVVAGVELVLVGDVTATRFSRELRGSRGYSRLAQDLAR